MKFDFAIGNPPYQEDRQGTSNTALPVYHNFLTAAYEVADKIEMIHPARFLFNAGRTPKEWNEQMLNDSHLKVLDYQQDASKVFSNTDIKGGVAITYYNHNEQYMPIETFTIYPEVNDILAKVKKYLVYSNAISSIAFVCNKFAAENLVNDFPQYSSHERRLSSNVLTFDCFHQQFVDGDITVYGVISNVRQKRFISPQYIEKDESLLKYKVIMPKADGNGVFGEKITNPEILSPQTAFTHTFLGLGSFNIFDEANNELKYIKTKFARALLSVAKVTQNVNADTWRYVPLQDFTSSSDIDWSVSIKNIDKQLYKKYGLSQEEIDFIENNVKEME